MRALGVGSSRMQLSSFDSDGGNGEDVCDVFFAVFSSVVLSFSSAVSAGPAEVWLLMKVALTATLTGDEEESSLEEEEGREEREREEGDREGDDGLKGCVTAWMGVRIRMVRVAEEGGGERDVEEREMKGEWRGEEEDADVTGAKGGVGRVGRESGEVAIRYEETSTLVSALISVWWMNGGKRKGGGEQGGDDGED